MYVQNKKNHLKNKYISCINKGPIFFTAPHSKKLNRGGKDYNQKLRVHKRQIYTSFLAADFARGTGKNSYMVWGVTNLINQADMDPNYLMKKHFGDSPFHQVLHYWAIQHSKQPILHIDIHGKMDRTYNCEIDVGIRSMEAHWKHDQLIHEIREFFAKYENIFEGLKFGKEQYECVFQTDPALHGYWSDNKKHTMTEQAIMLGIPSLQFEIPFSVRKKLFRDQSLRMKFHKLLMALYQRVIVSDFKKRERKMYLQKQIGVRFMASVGTGKEEEDAYNQLKTWEGKEEASCNANNKCI